MGKNFSREKFSRKTLGIFTALAFVGVASLPIQSMAQVPSRTKIGMLACDVSGGIAVVLASKKSVACMFTPSQPGPREVYTGSISKFGMEVGVVSGAEMVWSVLAPTNRAFGALAGNYAGAGAEATVGTGVGAHVLVGGPNRTVALQPLSLEGQTGVNLAGGVSELVLNPAR